MATVSALASVVLLAVGVYLLSSGMGVAALVVLLSSLGFLGQHAAS